MKNIHPDVEKQIYNSIEKIIEFAAKELQNPFFYDIPKEKFLFDICFSSAISVLISLTDDSESACEILSTTCLLALNEIRAKAHEIDQRDREDTEE